LVSFGVHIGDCYTAHHFLSASNYYLTSIRNSFFLFDLVKTVYFLKRAIHYISSLVMLFGRVLFYHSGIHSFINFKLILNQLVFIKCSQSFVNYNWMPGLASNFKKCLLRLLKLLLKLNVIAHSSGIGSSRADTFSAMSSVCPNLFLKYVFFRLLHLSYEKAILDFDWKLEFNRLKVFWKGFFFLKTFNSMFKLPDCLIIINPSNQWFPACEFSVSRKIPVVGVFDTSSDLYGITYLIPSNDDSIALGLFYISIFSNVCLFSTVSSYSRTFLK